MSRVRGVLTLGQWQESMNQPIRQMIEAYEGPVSDLHIKHTCRYARLAEGLDDVTVKFKKSDGAKVEIDMQIPVPEELRIQCHEICLGLTDDRQDWLFLNRQARAIHALWREFAAFMVSAMSVDKETGVAFIDALTLQDIHQGLEQCFDELDDQQKSELRRLADAHLKFILPEANHAST